MPAPPSVEVRLLRTILIVAATQNFTRAAERLGISQPSVSVQIRDLETALGTPLFARMGQRVTLTAAGRIFSERAEVVLSKLSEACQAVRLAEDQVAGHLSVGVIPPLHVPWMPRTLARIVDEHAGLAMTVTERTSTEIESGVETGRFEVGVGILSHASPHLAYEVLMRDEVMMLVRPDGEFGKKRSISARQLAELRLVLLPESFLIRQLIQEAFRRAHVLPRVALEIDTVEGVLATAVHTGLPTLMPRVVLEGRSAVALKPVPLVGWSLPLEFGLMWPGTGERSAVARVFADALRAVVTGKVSGGEPPTRGGSPAAPQRTRKSKSKRTR